MPQFERYMVPAQAFNEIIIEPSFQDLVPQTGSYFGTLPMWTYMSDVSAKRPIINIKRVQNILQRRDASCDLNYKKLMGATTRTITVDELYAATKACRNEFYQGSLKDWRNADDVFGNKIQPYFVSAFRTDMLTNGYFGDTARIPNPAGQFSTSEYNGVWKLLAQYTSAGVIPAGQTISAPTTDLRVNPNDAYNLIDGLYNKQSPLMRAFPASDKMFVVSAPVFDGFMKYLRSVGNADILNIVAMYANGVSVYSYNGIEIYVEPLWEAVLSELNPSKQPNAAILTLKSNFVFATDEQYGEGPDGKSALVIWYEWKEMTWYFQAFMKAGVQIALPEYTCYAI